MKNYLLTGASGGIGRVIAEKLLTQGDCCVLIGRNEERLSSLTEKYPNAVACIADLREPERVADIFSILKEKQGIPLDGFIHCAGVAPLMRIEECSMDVVRETYAVNLFSFLEIMKHFVEEGNYGNGAAVVAISSVTAWRGSNRQAVYAGTKAALEATIRCMARELLPRKIRVNAVVSGVVETEMLCKLREKRPGLDERLKTTTPLGVIPPEEVWKAVEYLLSDAAAHITGTSMAVDSGFLL